jgi:hypothetical protein
MRTVRAAAQFLRSGFAQRRRAINELFGKEICMRTIRFLLALLIMAIPAASFGQIGIRISIGPPALPVYDQPLCPGDGYIWTPGYWGWSDGGYLFNEGYWGPTVGFYGGINYGYGYWGGGYGGGRWDHGHFFYNTSVNHIDVVNIHNVYNERVEANTESRVSFNGGNGGIQARPTSEQQAAGSQRHLPAGEAQAEHVQAARSNPEQRAGANHGNPTIAATAKPGDFSQQRGAVSAQGSQQPSRMESGGSAVTNRTPVHPNDLAPIARPAPVNSGNAKADQRYEQQQDQLIARQTQERQQLQQRQETEHQRMPAAQAPQMEQKHQQQTQQLAQKHTSQQQSLQARQPQARGANGGRK